MVKLEKIGMGSAAKVYGLTLGGLAFFFGIFTAIIGSIFPPLDYFSLGGGLWWIIVSPVVYGIIGFVLGAFGALIYNFVASKTGGLEIELSLKESNPTNTQNDTVS